MWIHILIFLFYQALFLSSKGFFSKTAHLLADKFPEFLPITHKQMCVCLKVIFWGNLLGLAVCTASYLDTASIKDGYLVRNGKGEASYEEELFVSDGTYTQEIQVVVDPVAYTKEELEQFLEAAYVHMDAAVLGENESLQKVEHPLNLMTSLKGTPVAIEWSTDQPMLLSFEGMLGEDVPAQGKEVLLRGEMTAGECVRVYERRITVYPEKLSGKKALLRDVQQAVKSAGDTSEEIWKLPKEINGKTLIWHKNYASNGWLITLLSVFVGCLLIWKEQNEKKEAQKRRSQMLQKEYPILLNQLLLYMRAGISSRMAIERIVLEYERRIEKIQRKEPKTADKNLTAVKLIGKRYAKKKEERQKEAYQKEAYIELCRMYYEMEQGISEEEAYERFAKRCSLLEYRALSSLMVQNLRKGGNHLFTALHEECTKAFEERKRRALKAGEEAGTKLLVPMVLMLLVVLMMIMIPSFMEL